MRQIFGKLTSDLYKQTTLKTVGKDSGYKIKTFRELVEQVAKLSHRNKDFFLFYRGQKNDYKNKAGVSTFYPTIYRGDYLTQQELNYRFDLLHSASKLLIQEFKNGKIEVDKKNAAPTDYARLVDRVKINTGQKQIYGSQVSFNFETVQAYQKKFSR